MHTYFSVCKLTPTSPKKFFLSPLLLKKASGRLNQSESIYYPYVWVLRGLERTGLLKNGKKKEKVLKKICRSGS